MKVYVGQLRFINDGVHELCGIAFVRSYHERGKMTETRGPVFVLQPSDFVKDNPWFPVITPEGLMMIPLPVLKHQTSCC